MLMTLTHWLFSIIIILYYYSINIVKLFGKFSHNIVKTSAPTIILFSVIRKFVGNLYKCLTSDV